jgi:hypothetical protein
MSSSLGVLSKSDVISPKEISNDEDDMKVKTDTITVTVTTTTTTTAITSPKSKTPLANNSIKNGKKKRVLSF